MKLTYLQWNVWYRENIHNIYEYIAKYPTDIIALQELTINQAGQTESDTPAFIAKHLGYHYCVGGENFIEDGEDRWFGNAIFSKFPIKHHRQVWINKPIGSGGYDDEYRTYLEAVIDIRGIDLIVATTHMSYTKGFVVTDRKRAETEKLLSELKNNATKKFIFSGDMNAVPESYTVSEIRKLFDDAGPNYTKNSWTTKPFSYQGFEENELNWRLDYVFASRQVKVLSSSIEETVFSDHLPVRVEFDI